MHAVLAPEPGADLVVALASERRVGQHGADQPDQLLVTDRRHRTGSAWLPAGPPTGVDGRPGRTQHPAHHRHAKVVLHGYLGRFAGGICGPLFGSRPQHLILHGQLADLAFSLLERPIIGAAVRPLALQALLASSQEVIAPGSQPVRLDLQLPRQLLQRLAAQQPQHHLGLLAGRPARLRPIVLALLVMMVHRHEAIFTPAYPVSNPTGSNGRCG
jgi:hypothetical protein